MDDQHSTLRCLKFLDRHPARQPIVDASLGAPGFSERRGLFADRTRARRLLLADSCQGSPPEGHGQTGLRKVRNVTEYRNASPGPPIPDFLLPLRARAADLAGVAPDDLAEALITEYSPGAAIGWHKDAHPFDIVVGISLLSASRFRFRRGKVRAWETAEVPLPPRSAYVLTGPARTEWEHSIPPVKALRYSVTFRTLRRPV